MERAIYESAVGLEQTQTKVLLADGEVKKVKYKEKLPPNMVAARMWMAQRRNWHGADNDPNRPPAGFGGVINIGDVRGMTTEQIQTTLQMLRAVITPQTGQNLKRLDAVDIEAVLVPEAVPVPEVKKDDDPA